MPSEKNKILAVIFSLRKLIFSPRRERCFTAKKQTSLREEVNFASRRNGMVFVKNWQKASAKLIARIEICRT